MRASRFLGLMLLIGDALEEGLQFAPTAGRSQFLIQQYGDDLA